MARKVRDQNLDSRTAREKLKPRAKPYFKEVGRGVHLGYRKLRGRDGTWVIRFHVADQVSKVGKRQPYVIERLAAADDVSDSNQVDVLSFHEAADAARSTRDTRARDGAGVGPFTVADAMRLYIEYREGRGRAATDAEYHDQAFIAPSLGSVECAALTTEQIEKWLASVAKQPARVRTRQGEKQKYRTAQSSPESARRRKATANRILSTLKAALNHSWRKEKIPSDTAWRRVEPFEDVDAARVRYLQLPEAKRLVNACAPDFQKLVQGALLTGARYGQLGALIAADFNPSSETVTMRTRKGKGNIRTYHVSLTREGVEFFKRACAGKASDSRIFVKDSGEPWGKSHQKRLMVAACKAAKIEAMGIHEATRHTYASHAVMNGTPLLVVAKNLGHADTRMVEKHYGHLAPSYVADAIRKGAPCFGFKADRKVISMAR